MRRIIVFGLTVIALYLVGCNSTRYVPDGSYLLHKVDIKDRVKDVSKEEYKPYIRQKPNEKILGVWRFHLGMYNLSGRDTSKGFNKWLRKIGEAPVIYDEYLVSRTKEQLELFLNNKGYFNVLVEDTVIFSKRKKAKVQFNISSGAQYVIKDLKYQIKDTTLQSFVYSDTLKSLLKQGKPYDLSLHDVERERITALLKNNGYFTFSKQYIWFKADSANGDNSVCDTLVLEKHSFIDAGGVKRESAHKKYKIRNVYCYVDFDPSETLSVDTVPVVEVDTVVYNSIYFLSRGTIKIKPSIISSSNYIVPGSYYDASAVGKSQNLLSALSIYRFVNIRFKELLVTDSVSNEPLLDCFIQLVPGKAQAFSVELNGMNSDGNLGAGGNFSYQNKNLFNGADVFDFSVHSSLQNQFTRSSEKFNTFEFGAESSIEFPKFLLPIKLEGLRKRYNPSTKFVLAYNYQRRPDYERIITNASVSYDWKVSRNSFHSLSPVTINYVDIWNVGSEFQSIIDEIELLSYSYEKHLIASSAYSYVYNEQRLNQRKDFWYVKCQIEEAGNVLNTAATLFAKDPLTEYREVFGVTYAQYIKSDIDIRFHHYIGRISSLAYRGFLGVGYPYGNLKALPFEKKYFSGGANGVRAWPVRSLGPGSSSSDGGFYQTGDVKLEMNVEYRFKLFWIFEGAVFVDAGNIWNIRKDETEEEDLKLFKYDKFYEDLALGTGLGMRMDLNYFVFRIDMGLKVVDPSHKKGDRLVLGAKPFEWSDVAFNFAIGYPF